MQKGSFYYTFFPSPWEPCPPHPGILPCPRSRAGATRSPLAPHAFRRRALGAHGDAQGASPAPAPFPQPHARQAEAIRASRRMLGASASRMRRPRDHP